MVLCQGDRPFSIPRNVPLHIQAISGSLANANRPVNYYILLRNLQSPQPTNRWNGSVFDQSGGRIPAPRSFPTLEAIIYTDKNIITTQATITPSHSMRIYDERPRTNEKVQYLLGWFQNA